MTRRFGLVHLAMALAVGAAGGVAGGLHLHRMYRRWDPADPKMTARMVERVSHNLGLSAEQRTKLAAILDRTHQRFTALRGEVDPKFEAIRGQTRAEIETILTPEQVTRFRELHAKREARRKALGLASGER